MGFSENWYAATDCELFRVISAMRITRVAKIAGIVLICTIFLQSGCTLADMEYKKQAIPAKLKLGVFYAEGNCGDLLSYQGAYVFDIRRETVEALNRGGSHFFDDIGDPANAAHSMYFGGEWKPTPFPDNARDGPLDNMYCAMEHSWRWPTGIPDALRQRGGYYQSAGGRTLIVLPKQGYVVAIASDR